MNLDIHLKYLGPFCIEVSLGKSVRSNGKYEKFGSKMKGKCIFSSAHRHTLALADIAKVLDRNKL